MSYYGNEDMFSYNIKDRNTCLPVIRDASFVRGHSRGSRAHRSDRANCSVLLRSYTFTSSAVVLYKTTS